MLASPYADNSQRDASEDIQLISFQSQPQNMFPYSGRSEPDVSLNIKSVRKSMALA